MRSPHSFIVFMFTVSTHQIFLVLPTSSTESFVIFEKVLWLKFSDLDLRSSIHYYKTRTSSTGSSVSPTSTDGLRSLHRCLHASAWLPRARELFGLTNAWRPCKIPLPPSATALSGFERFQWFLLLRGLPLARLQGRLPLHRLQPTF
jgi:hypothetical protein